MLSRPVAALRSSPAFHGAAMDGIAVVVNKENPVNGLSSEQIKNIFTGSVTDWASLSK